jgi:hypothetical protein
MVNGATITYFSGLANHDPHTMIEKNTLAQLRARVNFYAGDPP